MARRPSISSSAWSMRTSLARRHRSMSPRASAKATGTASRSCSRSRFGSPMCRIRMAASERHARIPLVQTRR